MGLNNSIFDGNFLDIFRKMRNCGGNFVLGSFWEKNGKRKLNVSFYILPGFISNFVHFDSEISFGNSSSMDSQIHEESLNIASLSKLLN